MACRKVNRRLMDQKFFELAIIIIGRRRSDDVAKQTEHVSARLRIENNGKICERATEKENGVKKLEEYAKSSLLFEQFTFGFLNVESQ